MSDEIMKQIPIEDIVGDRFGRYSKYIIQDRALPDVRDGLKPVQRRILYAMFHDKNYFDKPYRKSAKTVGLVIGNYHPHGDSSVYDAMVRLSQEWKMNMPLIDMQGNNGSIDDDPAAAMRYTEARLSKLAHLLLTNIEENVVPFVLNFDDMTTEPSVLPASYPNLLINGSSGIAAGYATNIPPFNLGEILDALIYRLHHPESTLDELSMMVRGPDFPTGAIIQGQSGIDDIMRTGRGRIVVRAQTEIIVKKTMTQIVVTELPYEVIKAQVVRKIDDLRFNRTSEGFGDITDVRDESDRNGLKIVIDCKAGSDAQSILNLLYKHSELQIFYNANMVAIVDRRPKVCSLLEILDSYISFRQEVVLARSRYRYQQKEKRIHIIEGLIKAVSVMDEIIRIIRASKNRSDSRDNIITAFDFSLEQASAIVDLQLYRLSSTDIHALRDEFATLANDLEYLDGIINNQSMLNHLMVTEFNQIKNDFSIPRRSSVEAQISEIEVDKMNLITNESVMVTLSQSGYIKRVSMRSYASSQQGIIALKEGDVPIISEAMETLEHLVFVTDQGRYGLVLVHDLEEARWRDVGAHLNQYVKMKPDENVIAGFRIKSFTTHMFIVTATAQGLIKKTLISELEVKRTNRLYDLMTLGKNDALVYAAFAQEQDSLVLVSEQAQLIRIDLADVNPIGLKAKGIIGMKLRAHDRVVDGCIVAQQSDVVILSSRYQMKRIKMDDLPVNNRATLGILVARKVKTNPHHITGIFSGNIYDDIRMYSARVETIAFKDVPLMGLDASFSNVSALDQFSVIEPCLDVKMVEKPPQSTLSSAQPLKLDL